MCKMELVKEKWRGTECDFYPPAHEHLHVYEKPAKDEKMSEFKDSVKWR